MHYELGVKSINRIYDRLLKDKIPASEIHLLGAIPDLAKQESMREALTAILTKNTFCYIRTHAAEVLDHIGDPIGTEHLVYNSLVVHPLLKIKQVKDKWWGGGCVKIADKLNKKQVQFFIDDMIEHKLFLTVITLAYAKTDNIVPAMLKLLDAEQILQRYAAFVLAYHGNSQGALILKEWAEATPPQYPTIALRALQALSLLPGNKWLDYLQQYLDPKHLIYQDKKYGAICECIVLSSLQSRLALKKASTLQQRADILFSIYGQTLHEIEVYDGSQDGNTIIRKVDPSVNILGDRGNSKIPIWITSPDLLMNLGDIPLQVYLAEEQRIATLQLIKRARLRSENMVGLTTSTYFFMGGSNRTRGIHKTGLLRKDCEGLYNVPVKIFYDTEDYLDAATDWILNPLRHISWD